MNISLEAKTVHYYSPSDEAAMFEWLNKLTCVVKYHGKGDILFIEVDPRLVDDLALRELLALFSRYDIDMKQLAQFDKDKFSEWFRSKKAYWFNAVFGNGA